MIHVQLYSRIPEIIGDLDPDAPELNAALKEGAEAIAADARDRVPVDEGTLRDAIHVEAVDHGYSVVAGDDEAFYGHIVEFGGVRTTARPFLVPAGEARREDVLGLVENVLENV